jgi:hypothetical protein
MSEESTAPAGRGDGPDSRGDDFPEFIEDLPRGRRRPEEAATECSDECFEGDETFVLFGKGERFAAMTLTSCRHRAVITRTVPGENLPRVSAYDDAGDARQIFRGRVRLIVDRGKWSVLYSGPPMHG